jgi:hypothetical protein
LLPLPCVAFGIALVSSPTGIKTGRYVLIDNPLLEIRA